MEDGNNVEKLLGDEEGATPGATPIEELPAEPEEAPAEPVASGKKVPCPMCKKKYSKAGLRGHLKFGHKLSDEEATKIVRSFGIGTGKKPEPPEREEVEEGPPKVEEIPPVSVELQAKAEMLEVLKSGILLLPYAKNKEATVKYIEKRIESNPSFLEDKSALFNLLLQTCGGNQQYISPIVEDVWRVRIAYNLDNIRAIRSQPFTGPQYGAASPYGPYGQPTTPQPNYGYGYPPQTNQPPYPPQYPPPYPPSPENVELRETVREMNRQVDDQRIEADRRLEEMQRQNQEAIKLIEDQLKKKDEDTRHEKELAETKKDRKEAERRHREEIKAIREATDKRMEKLETLIIGKDEKRKFEDLEIQMSRIAGGTKEQFKKFEDVMVDFTHTIELKDKDRAIEEQRKEREREMQKMVEKMDSLKDEMAKKKEGGKSIVDELEELSKFQAKMGDMAQLWGFKKPEGPKSFSDKLGEKSIDLLDKLDKTILGEQQGKDYIAPEAPRRFEQMSSVRRGEAIKEAQQKAQMEERRLQMERTKLEEENKRLKELERQKELERAEAQLKELKDLEGEKTKVVKPKQPVSEKPEPVKLKKVGKGKSEPPKNPVKPKEAPGKPEGGK